MDVRWHEAQRAFQARVLIDDSPNVALRPYRTFVGPAAVAPDRRVGRVERVVLLLVAGALVVALLLAAGVAREFAALTASFTGGVALVVAVSPSADRRERAGWTPLMALYSPSVIRGAAPVCITEISGDEFTRLGVEGFGTVVGLPRPGATFGLFVDEHLVWPRTPPRGPISGDPEFGTA